MFVLENDEGEIVASGILNKNQVEIYEKGNWEFKAKADEVMVLHTLVVDPMQGGKGYAKSFVEFYEQYARQNGCITLRIDTQEKNSIARKMYKKLGFREADIVPCEFNGIKGVSLVLLEKKL